MPNRRQFLASLGAAAAFAPLNSYARILGANDRIHMAAVGINNRGKALASAIMATPAMHLQACCDVDSRTFDGLRQHLQKGESSPTREFRIFKDYRKLLELPDLDAVAIATPEHWHMPMALMALKAGKHVYLEKPCSFNPAEGELLVEAQRKYGKLIQMGNQQRSAASSREAIEAIHQGAIGRTYAAKAWYANRRASIGQAENAPVPDWLDWELRQGPAPRQAYQNPWVHYNWHWHRKWGTGEINNNGTHEIDICRWALDVDYPESVQSAGGRFHFEDAWEWFDTQQVQYRYAENKIISWDGFSCNPSPTFNRGRGSWIGGTEGYAILDRDGATLYNMEGQPIFERREQQGADKMNTLGIGPLDVDHMKNFAAGIQRAERLHSPIDDANISQWHCHLGNIAQDLNELLHIDISTGKVKNSTQALAFWSREYEPGWEPVL